MDPGFQWFILPNSSWSKCTACKPNSKKQRLYNIPYRIGRRVKGCFFYRRNRSTSLVCFTTCVWSSWFNLPGCFSESTFLLNKKVKPAPEQPRRGQGRSELFVAAAAGWRSPRLSTTPASLRPASPCHLPNLCPTMARPSVLLFLSGTSLLFHVQF